ncbi:hypothetical protein [Brevundimonas pondensis]|uniref:50S ribosomal protein L29 n=1 Tax=Brevundimonas pondensis TaxID=2774189 RepID=A0ABX7SLV1_9CAUL|nr:hypothetical protein [Brevundimonas pondensis]QTC88013.1 hypothetical protein IFE19_00975 [Brevundimonas pondensis]
MTEIDERIARLKAKESALRNRMFDLVGVPGSEKHMRTLEKKTEIALSERIRLVGQKERSARLRYPIRRLFKALRIK